MEKSITSLTIKVIRAENHCTLSALLSFPLIRVDSEWRLWVIQIGGKGSESRSSAPHSHGYVHI